MKKYFYCIFFMLLLLTGQAKAIEEELDPIYLDKENNVIYGDELWTSLFYVDNFSFTPSEVDPVLCVSNHTYKLNNNYCRYQKNIKRVIYKKLSDIVSAFLAFHLFEISYKFHKTVPFYLTYAFFAARVIISS